MNEKDVKDILKIIVLGASGVGKYTLLDKFAEKSVVEKTKQTIGLNFFQKSVMVDECNYKLQFWDFVDDDKFKFLHSQYYSGASAVIFIFDLTRPDTFDYHAKCLKRIWNQVNLNRLPLLLIGNKLDLIKNTDTIDREKYREFVKKEGLMAYIEASMQNIDNFEEAILELVQQIIIRKPIYLKKKLTNLRSSIMKEINKEVFPLHRNGEYLMELNETELIEREKEKKKREEELKKVEKTLKRSYQVKFLVTSKELDEIKKNARLSHQTQSDFIRSAIWKKIGLLNLKKKNNFFKNLKKIVQEDLKEIIPLDKISESYLETKEEETNSRLKELRNIREILERLEKQERQK